MKNICLSIFFGIILKAQIVTTTPEIYQPLQRAFDIILSSNSFHSAKVEKSFGFDIGVAHHYVQLPNELSNFEFDGKVIDAVNMRTLRATMDLPIYVQVGMNIALPSYKIREYDTNLIGYSAKLQIDPFLTDYMPYTALQYNSNKIELGNFFTSRTDSYQLQFSSKILLFHLYAGMMLNFNDTQLIYNSDRKEINDSRKEFYYRAGLNVELLFINIYGEMSINQEMDYKNISVGVSIKI
jgi:hypothetical protein